MTNRYFQLEVEHHIATLRLNSPPVNALSTSVLKDLTERMDKMEHDPNVRVVIIQSAVPKFFAVGADIKEIQGFDGEKGYELNRLFQNTFNKVAKLSKPTICVVDGYAIGGGAELALACDIRIATENAQFALPEASLGLIPAGGGTQRLPRLISAGKAKELMFTGERIKADEALKIGLVEHVVPRHESDSFVKTLAEKISEKAPIAIRAIKKAVNEGLQHDMDEGLKIELEESKYCFDTHDFHEGVNAFLNKRKPKFTNN